ncbi:MAG: endonuclease/exonuclease/phosphatase family protein, partial [Planctomycetota bacterium]
DAFWRDRFGDQFFVERPGGGLTILSRGMIGRTESVELPGGARAATAKLKIGGERANLLVVDLPSNPLSNRAESLRTIAELAEEMSQRRPTILAGDFNTPPESVHFNDLRRAGFVHAFERHGSGYAATWPSVAPALHLDHVWLSPGFDAGETWHGWTVRSDHRPVFSPVRVAPARFEAYQTAAAAAAQDIDAE